MKQYRVQLNDRVFPWFLIRKRISGVRLRVKDGAIYVSAPYFVSLSQAREIVLQNEKWILNACRKEEETPTLRLVPGEKVALLGESYEIAFGEQPGIRAGRVVVREGKERRDFLALAVEVLAAYATPQTRYYFSVMYPANRYLFPTIKYRLYKSQYGHYNKARHEIAYNIALAGYRKEVIDGVIVHELAHLQEFNHRRGFYTLVETILPDYRLRRRRLREERVRW